MTPEQIKAFIDAMAASDLHEMEVSHGGWTLRLTRGAPAPVAPAASGRPAMPMPVPQPEAGPVQAQAVAAAAAPSSEDVSAPLFGVVHLQSAPGAAPFVQAGQHIEAGQVLCTIEAMKVFNEVRAERAGRVGAVLVDSGVEVEAGQALFRLEGDAHV